MLPASTALSGTPTGVDSFALTLGRALESTPSSVQDGSSIAPKASPISPRAKGELGSSSDSSAMAGFVLNCFVAGILQPAPSVTLNSEGAPSTVSLPSPESSSELSPSFASSLNATVGETSTNIGTLSIPAAMVHLAAPGKLSAWVDKGVGTMVPPPVGAPKSTARERVQATIQSGVLVSPTGENQLEGRVASQPVSAPPWFPVHQDIPPRNPLVAPQSGRAPSESKQAGASNPVSAQESRFSQEPLTSPRSTISMPALKQLVPTQMQGAPVPTPQATGPSRPFSATDHSESAQLSSPLEEFAGPYLRASSNPALYGGQTRQTAPTFTLETSGTSTHFSPADYPEPADYSSLLGKVKGGALQTTCNPTLSRGQAQQTAPALGTEADDSSTPFASAIHPEFANPSSLLGKSIGTEVQAVSNPKLSGGQTEHTTPAFRSEVSDSSTPFSEADHPELAELSSMLGKFVGASEVHTASSPTLAGGQTGQTAPASGLEVGDSSSPFSAADHPELAEFSSMLGKFVGAEVHTASRPPLSGSQTGQAAHASGLEVGHSSTRFSTPDSSEVAEFPTLPREFARADLPAASNPTPSTGQVGQDAVARGPERAGFSTPASATDPPEQELTEFSSLMGKVASAEVQTASIPTASGGQTEQTAPISGPDVSETSTPIEVTNPPALAEFSSLMGEFAGSDLQVVADPTSSTGEVGQAPPAPDSEGRDSSTPVSAPYHHEMMDFSTLLGSITGGQIDEESSRNVTHSPKATDNFRTKSTPAAAGTPIGSQRVISVHSVQVPPAPKFENLASIPAKVTLRSTQVSSGQAAEVAWQAGNMSETASAPAPVLSSTSPIPAPPLEPNSQPATPGTDLQKDAPPEVNSVQPIGAVSAGSSGITTHANLSDSSTGGQGKSGQQTGSAPADNQADVKVLAPSPANNPTPDPTSNLLTPHPPSVPASHTNASAPQTAPSPSQPTTTLSAWQNYDGGAGRIVRSASLSDSANGAEMHVELRTGALGPLDVHAIVHEGSVGAEIHVQGQEAHTLLAAGLPSLERALGERNLRVENINIHQDQAGGGMSGGEKQDSQSGSSPSPQRQVLPWDSPPQVSNAGGGSSEDEELTNPAPGLSVQA